MFHAPSSSTLLVQVPKQFTVARVVVVRVGSARPWSERDRRSWSRRIKSKHLGRFRISSKTGFCVVVFPNHNPYAGHDLQVIETVLLRLALARGSCSSEDNRWSIRVEAIPTAIGIVFVAMQNQIHPGLLHVGDERSAVCHCGELEPDFFPSFVRYWERMVMDQGYPKMASFRSISLSLVEFVERLARDFSATAHKRPQRGSLAASIKR